MIIVNFSRCGAICELESAKAPLCDHRETGMWRHCLRPKKVALSTFRRQEKCFKCVIIHERPKICVHTARILDMYRII